MAERSLGQGDLPEIGHQSVVALILNGKRQLAIRQLKALAQRFHFAVDAFICRTHPRRFTIIAYN